MPPRTLLDKIWDAHVVAERQAAAMQLLWIDRHFLHEGSFHAFRQLAERGERGSRAVADVRRRRSLCAGACRRHADA